MGNGSDEIIDMLIRMLLVPGKHSVVCFEPCFSIYPIQAQVCGVEVRRHPLNPDFSFDLDALFALVDDDTRLVFVTTPDNPSGYCPPLADVRRLAQRLGERFPHCLLVVDEAYMDFAGDSPEDEARFSLLASGDIPDNVAIMRTFSKSYGLAGLRLGYGILPAELAQYYWRARLPFSVNILAEEAGIAVLQDSTFRAATLECVRAGRRRLTEGLRALGCTVWPSAANFIMMQLPEGCGTAAACFEALLQRGIIIRPLKSYSLPDHLRVSVGSDEENTAFLEAMKQWMQEVRG